MNEIKALLKAQKDLQAATENIPQNIREAAEKISEKTGMDYYGALEVVDMVLPAGPKKARIAKRSLIKRLHLSEEGRQSIVEANKKKKGFGGRINPKNISEIKERIAKNKGDKRESYKAALELFKRKGEWVSRKELQDLDINTKMLRNKRKMNPCLPIGYIVQSSCHGYRAYNISEALA